MSVAAAVPSSALDPYSLEDRYRRESGRVFMTGTQALVKLPLMQRAIDRAAGLNTAGFVSGYRGSPLGGYDQELWRAKHFLDAANVRFLPAVNEDLAATAVHGTQQVEADPTRDVDGVFGIWYGKGPGVDRAGDALKHGNAYGSSPNGGVLVVAGDDHGCVSSSMPHQSDVAFLTWLMPNLHPASVAEFLEFGLYGLALSRYSGMWVGFKAISETVESAMSFDLPPYPEFAVPDYEPPATGLHIRWPDFPGPQIEERLEAKKAATLAFAKANPIDRKIFGISAARYGIVTTGKAHLDLMEALRLLGIDRDAAEKMGLDVYKVGMVWPLAHDSALDFVRGKREVLVIEEKRGLIESQFKEYFYDYPGRKPERMVGKEDEHGKPLVPWVGELAPNELAQIVARRLDAIGITEGLVHRAERLIRPEANVIDIAGATRTPYFCSGCPHNTSTKVPEGSEALAGIGCHFMASWMDRDTDGLIQMGGEGVNWAARSMFNGGRHVFQNLGDGTYYHSGSLAIRQALAAQTNITYKILFNDAVAMTGGQPVDGPLSVQAIAHSVRAEGVQRIALVSDEPELYSAGDLPQGVTIDHRRELDAVQRELRDIPGVSVLIYAQTCATEKRRRRKRGLLEDPKKFVVINDLVCEGCGDCSVASNCLSVVPKETPFGRKRQIDQDSCNKDYACVGGFCPSFVSVEGAERRPPESATRDSFPATRIASLPEPTLSPIDNSYDLLVTGVGGTGVVTVGALITMAAHLNRQGASVLDFMGFAQKFGPVLSYIRIANRPDDLNQVRIDNGQADALIGCDLVVSSSPQASRTYRKDKTRAVVNSVELATADFVRNPDANLQSSKRLAALRRSVGSDNLDTLAAHRLSTAFLGDSIYANVLMLGFAWQRGLVPVPRAALEAAIELNGVKIEENLRAFSLGRLAAEDADVAKGLDAGGDPRSSEPLDARIARFEEFLVGYQNRQLANRYRELVDRVQEAENTVSPDAAMPLTDAVARAYFKVLAYKDEYEVARLHTRPEFLEHLKAAYGDDATLKFHLAPPLLSSKLDERGRPRKREFGAWVLPLFRMLARCKQLRGSKLDIFGYTAERKAERALIREFEKTIDTLLLGLTETNHALAVDTVGLYLKIRGYGPVKETAAAAMQPEIENAVAKFVASKQRVA